ncbi:MAG: insulinase family protein [Alphaproteobacteria bacterium]|uniref:Insulinase family protein n=1 Tax=Candidatus Nitrobium versatile TaxID=2884831 RepID=A0A953M3L7_9BACT|nr:insulinase family protein [Candidatus Nitrobium versatile]
MSKRIFLFILFFLVAPLSAEAASLTSSIKEYTLQNGMKALLVEDHKAPLVTLQVWYKVGSVHEPIGKTGMSHLLEHMMFKGTPKYGSKEFSAIIQRNGGTDNAYTTKEHTVYFQSIASDRADIPIELESDRMSNLLLDPKEVAAERSVVMEERRMRYEDDPQNLLYEEMMAMAFTAHPYRWPVIGWMSDIASIEREHLYPYYKKYYSPDNAFIVIAGDVTPATVLPLLEKSFGTIPRAGARSPEVPTKQPKQQGEKRLVMRKEEAELPYILIAYHVPSFPHEDNYALDVLSSILSAGKSSRLYRDLVYEKRIAISAFADYSSFHKDPFLFILGANAAPGKDIEAVERELYAHIRRIADEPPTGWEVQKAKNDIEASFIFAQDSNYTKAQYAGMFEMMGGWRLMDTYLEGIKKVTPAEVQAVAKRYFSDDNKTVGILLPLKKQ